VDNRRHNDRSVAPWNGYQLHHGRIYPHPSDRRDYQRAGQPHPGPECGLAVKTNTLLAVILIAIGIVAFAYQGITFKTKGKPVDLGPIEVTTEKTNRIPLPPIVGAIALVGGIVLLVTETKK